MNGSPLIFPFDASALQGSLLPGQTQVGPDGLFADQLATALAASLASTAMPTSQQPAAIQVPAARPTGANVAASDLLPGADGNGHLVAGLAAVDPARPGLRPAPDLAAAATRLAAPTYPAPAAPGEMGTSPAQARADALATIDGVERTIAPAVVDRTTPAPSPAYPPAPAAAENARQATLQAQTVLSSLPGENLRKGPFRSGEAQSAPSLPAQAVTAGLDLSVRPGIGSHATAPDGHGQAAASIPVRAGQGAAAQATDGQAVAELADASKLLARWKDAGGADLEPGALGVPTEPAGEAASEDRAGARPVLPADDIEKVKAGSAPAATDARPATLSNDAAVEPRNDAAALDRLTAPAAIDGTSSEGDVVERGLDLAPARLRPQTAHPAAGAQVAVQIVRSLQQGVDRFSVQLHPHELGGVEIQLDFERAGRVTALITAERPETLELLQRDSRFLERNLGDSGVKLSGDGLSFALKQDQQQQQQGQGFQERAGSQGAEASTRPHRDASADPDPGPAPIRRDGVRLLDIRT